MKLSFPSIVICALVLAPLTAGAVAPKVPATVTPSGTTFELPARAAEVAPGVFSLGETFDEQSGKTVTGYAIVHTAKKYNPAKPSGVGGGGSTKCYAFMASGAKWKNVEPWVMNGANNGGFSEYSAYNILNNAITLWEDAADGAVNNVGVNIIGEGTLSSSTLVADETATDNLNEVYFGHIADAQTIGVTIVWGIFSGPTFNRQLVEWDQIYNTQYDWSVTGEAGKMDFQNIGTHELGHTFGLADLYTSSCAKETMYGYGTEGETQKRDLGAGDILGISTLY